ncbi:long-chain-fatty-acid--CoA ligase [Dictyobacter vulcani]|uniref:Long-chain-fatty-acid--CoA ligase n=1 Tax=Dictyobacter vulcani TaxID=2607529 RepID=A0A5J4KYS3_9CHLR|nr:long-chain fatty acid--CoA ligase [Dictyobacter vulcani]GER91299.1 long-chain-fatty-acid--CoA ligase [Dictyobacter vulcani]
MTFITPGEWLARRELLSPAKVGLIDDETGTHFTYHTLNLRARALAAYLQQSYHLQQGERVAILAFNAPEYLDAFFACTLLGAILVPLNWRLTVRELSLILDDCQPRLLLYDSDHADLISVLQHSWQALPAFAFQQFPGAEKALAAQVRSFITNDGEEPALILYTSGTTGRPKGVMLSQRMITWNAINTQVSWRLREEDIAPAFAPFFHAGGLNVLTTPLYHLGGTVVLLRHSAPQTIFSAIERLRCTVVFAVPTVFQQMLEHTHFSSTDFSSVRFFIAGGSPCPPGIIAGYAKRGLGFRQGYGLTEVGVNCFSLAPEYALSKAGSVGQPIFHSRARIVDEHDQDVPPGEVGELVLSGPHVCSGYWQQPEATAEANHGGWWHTGDQARCDAEGFYYIVGRKKDMFISGGENIYPAEVESVIITHPKVLEVAVIPQPDARWGEVGLAVVVPRIADSLSAQEILDFCAGKLARYKLPRTVRFVEVLPRNVMGKIMKAELVKEFQHTI